MSAAALPALGTINLIPAENKYYKDQLVPVKKFSAYSPQSGTITLYWDKMGRFGISTTV